MEWAPAPADPRLHDQGSGGVLDETEIVQELGSLVYQTERLADAALSLLHRRGRRRVRAAHRIVPQRRRVPRARGHLAASREPLPALRRAGQALAERSRHLVARASRQMRLVRRADLVAVPARGGIRQELAFALVAWAGSLGGRRRLSVAAVAGRAGRWVSCVLVAYLYFAAISIVLTLIDLDTHRLPNAHRAAELPRRGGVLLTSASLLTGDWGALLRAGIGMAALYAFYFVLAARPAGRHGRRRRQARRRRRHVSGLARLGSARGRRLRGVRPRRHVRHRADRCFAGRVGKTRDSVRPVDDRWARGSAVHGRSRRALVRELTTHESTAGLGGPRAMERKSRWGKRSSGWR